MPTKSKKPSTARKSKKSDAVQVEVTKTPFMTVQVANTRYKWFTLMLYPDNPYHMEFLEWAKGTDMNFCYILHEGELNDDGTPKKDHYHVLIHFDSQRSPQAVASSLGTMPCKQDGENFVPLHGSELETYRVNTPSLIVEKPLVVFPYTCDYCRDPHDYLHYMIHDTFASRGKKKYKYSDITFHEKMQLISSYWGVELTDSTDTISLLYTYFQEYKTCPAVMSALLKNGEFKLVEYCRKNPYFLKTFFERKGVDA